MWLGRSRECEHVSRQRRCGIDDTERCLQVRKQGEWVDVPGAATPPYPMTDAAGTNQTYVFGFSPIAVDGVRLIGAPGGAKTFTSAAEVRAQYN